MAFFKSVGVGEKPFPSLALRCSLPILLGGRTSRCLPPKTLRSLCSLPSFCLLAKLAFYRKPVGLLPSFALRNSYNFNFSCINKKRRNSRKIRLDLTPSWHDFYPPPTTSIIARKCCAFSLLPSFVSRTSHTPPFAPNSVKEKTGGIILPKRQAFLPQKIRRFFL